MSMQYLVGVSDTDNLGRLTGTHHVSSTVADSAEDAKKWAVNDTACDWGYEGKDVESLHVLFVMEYPIGCELTVVEYDEGPL